MRFLVLSPIGYSLGYPFIPTGTHFLSMTVIVSPSFSSTIPGAVVLDLSAFISVGLALVSSETTSENLGRCSGS